MSSDLAPRLPRGQVGWSHSDGRKVAGISFSYTSLFSCFAFLSHLMPSHLKSLSLLFFLFLSLSVFSTGLFALFVRSYRDNALIAETAV